MPDYLPSPLPLFDRKLMRIVERIVPAEERGDWLRTWQAELWHVHHPRRHHRPLTLWGSIDLSIGLICDAAWLRTNSWRRAYSGTAIACLVSLVGLVLFSVLVGLALTGGWSQMSRYAAAPFQRFLVEAPLVVFVTFAIESRRYFDQRSTSAKAYWLKRRLFFLAKTVLLLLLAFLLSADAMQPIHAQWPNTSELFQTLFFVILALVGLRWAFQDQQQRCKECLRSLATAERVGRPSHNFLEWNGTELACRNGHGVLSVPEMETSWCRSSQWQEQPMAWNRIANI